jgi:hypothetical protein
VATAAIATVIGAGLLATALGALAGGVVAAGISYAGSAILGSGKAKNQSPAATAGSTTRAAQDRRQMVRSTVEPRAIVYGLARVSGPLVYASSSGEDQRYLHLVIPLAAHRVSRIVAVHINDTRVPDEHIGSDGMVILGDLTGKARIKRYRGDQTAADPDLVAESTDGWSAAHVLRGVAYIYVRLEYDADTFPNGLQNISAEVQGKDDIYDPRTGGTGWTDRAALCILDYMRSPLGLDCDDDEIDFPAFTTAANICDEAVQVDAGGAVQPRYSLGGAFGLDRAPISIMEDMLAACAGVITYPAGAFRLHVGAYDAPTDTLTVSDLAGPIELLTKRPRSERFNAVRGTFIDPSKNFQAADFPPVSDATAATEDGEVIWQDLELPAVNDGLRAQRLAQMALRRHREALVVRVPVQYRGLRYAVWQTLSVTIADFGWTAKVFRVTAWAFDPNSGIVNLTLAEESAFSYAWTYEAANALGPAPDTNLVSPFNVPAPGGLTMTEELYVAQGNRGVATRAILTWLPPPNPFTTSYQVQVAPAGTEAWQDAATTQGEQRALIEDLPEGLYRFRVRARNLYGTGAWAELQARIGNLIAQPPEDITGLQVQAIGGLAYLSWDAHPDLDVRFGGQIEFRHTPQTSSPVWSASTGIGSAVPGASTFAVLPLKAGTYFAKATDAGGRYSVNEAGALAQQASAVTFTAITTATEHTAFSGTKTNTVVTSSTLRLDSTSLIDGAADFDAIADIDSLGGITGSGSYAFANAIDLTTVKNCRLTGRIAATVVNTNDLVDSRTGGLDDWLDFDGVAGNEADAWIEVRQTDDNPAGSPTWGAWTRLDSGEFRARAFQFRAQLRTSDPAFNIHVSELSVTADEVL